MKILSHFKDRFYIKAILESWLALCVAYSFLIFQFIWGNHDWGHIVNKVNLSSSFFEARYSIHLFQLLFFDGNILPVIMFVLTLLAITVMSVIGLLYLGVSKIDTRYVLTIFLIGILPYNYIMIYYFYTSFSVYFWAVIGILALIYAEHSAKWYKVLGVSVILFLILGSYPPIISMLLVLFMAKRLCDFIDNKQNIEF